MSRQLKLTSTKGNQRMTNARFLQIHTLHSYAGALLNRDETGLAKRLADG